MIADGRQMNYQFTFTVGARPITDADRQRLSEVGCQDCKPFEVYGIWNLFFQRKGDSLDDSIRSAMEQVIGCGFTVSCIELELEQELFRDLL